MMKQRNYTPLIVILSIVINAVILVLYFMPKSTAAGDLDLTFLPFFNAVMNSFTFVFLLAALVSIVKYKNVKLHRNYIFAAFTSTFFFLISYLVYHYSAPSTAFGGEGIIRPIYYFVLLSHILLSIVIVPLALITAVRGLTHQTEKHRKIARWTMPIWLYVSATGVIVYIMISPYY
jgi:putative membrane protein